MSKKENKTNDQSNKNNQQPKKENSVLVSGIDHILIGLCGEDNQMKASAKIRLEEIKVLIDNHDCTVKEIIGMLYDTLLESYGNKMKEQNSNKNKPKK